MDDSKIFMFPDGGTSKTSNDVNSLLPLLMCNGGFGGGNWIWIIFLFFLYPLMRNGGLFGNFGQNGAGCLGPLANMVNNNDGRDLLMQAINGNGAATQRLATMFGTKVDMIQAAIAQVNNGITQVGCKIDSSTGALLNAGTQNTMTLANQLATCCCNLKSAITEGNYQNQIATIQQTDAIKQSVGDVGNAVTRGFSDMGYALRDQTCNIDKSIDNNDNPYDAVFAANMCKADYLGSSITDEKHLCLYVKDVIDDVDGYDGIVFNRWYADMCRKGVQVDWYECR